MHVTGTFDGAYVALDGSLKITFLVNEKSKAIEEIESIKDAGKLTIDATRYRERRSLNANAYFWQLVDKMAKVVGSDKWTMYLLMLSQYGVFSDVTIPCEALETIKKHFRYVEVLADGFWIETSKGELEALTARCFYGSSGYDTKEMSDLLNGTKEDAKVLGVEVLTEDEIKAMIASWKGDDSGF